MGHGLYIQKRHRNSFLGMSEALKEVSSMPEAFKKTLKHSGSSFLA